jgi:hypothetical protein
MIVFSNKFNFKKMKKIISILLLVVVTISFCTIETFSQARKKVLMENWTSSTCGPCASNNPQLRVWVGDHWPNLVAVAYHVGWPSPGNDPMYLYNPTQSYDRRYYYSVNSVPEGILEGFYTYIGYPFNFANMSFHYDLDTSTTVASGVSVIDTRIPPDSNKVNVTVTNYTALPSGTYYLRVMAVERWIIYQSPPGSNGETIFENVFRRSFPNSTGTAISTNAGTYNFEFRYKIDPVWKDTSIITIAFIQNDADHSVMNTGRQGMITGVTPNFENVPAAYTLSQNFPNPFNPSTNIKFDLPKNEYVTLRIYDILGNEVKTLVDGDHKAGQYNIAFDGTGLSSGIYFYTLRTNSFTETKKMMLVK